MTKQGSIGGQRQNSGFSSSILCHFWTYGVGRVDVTIKKLRDWLPVRIFYLVYLNLFSKKRAASKKRGVPRTGVTHPNLPDVERNIATDFESKTHTLWDSGLDRGRGTEFFRFVLSLRHAWSVWTSFTLFSSPKSCEFAVCQCQVLWLDRLWFSVSKIPFECLASFGDHRDAAACSN